MRERYSAAVAVVSIVAALGAGIALIRDGQASMTSVAVAVIGIVAGSMVAPAVSGGNSLPVSMSVAAALPFIFVVGQPFSEVVGVDLNSVVGIYLIAYVGLSVVSAVRRESVAGAIGRATRHVMGFVTFAVAFSVVRRMIGDSLGTSGWEVLVPFLVAGLLWFAVEVGLWALLAAADRRVSARYLARAVLDDANVFVSLVATGALFGLMFEALGWWALPVSILPYSFAHGAFRRFQETRATYKQTIRALARIPEAAGLNIGGHADRTAALSVAMAKDLGLTPDEVEDVEFTALMHDIGRITLNEPSVVSQGWTDDDLARWGAEIIGGAPSLARVAGYVRHQYQPFRKPGEETDPTVSTAARIVKAASTYDANQVGRGLSPLQSLEELHQGAAYEYDPEVVAALRRVLDMGSMPRRPLSA